MRHPVSALVRVARCAGVLALGAAPTLLAAGAESTSAPQVQVQVSAPDRIELADSSLVTGAPIPIGIEEDVYCSGFLGPREKSFIGSVFSAENIDSQTIFMEGDLVYLDIGTSRGVAPGQEFWVVHPDRVVYRWGSATDEIGRIYETPGRVRVVCVQENTAIAEIVRSCSDVNIGDKLMVFEPIPIPLVKRTRPVSSCDPPNGKVTGRIVNVKENAIPVVESSVVYLDIGERDGLVPGDFLSVFRMRGQLENVRTMLGELAIVTTQPHTAVGVITASRDTMFAGDEVELK